MRYDDASRADLIAECVRADFANRIALLLLEGSGNDLHMSGWHGGRTLTSAKPLTTTQRARVAAAVLERGQVR